MPPMPARQSGPLGLVALAKVMRHNPVESLADVNFQLTRVSGPFLGVTIHTLSGPDEIKAVLLDDVEAWRKSPVTQRILRSALGDAILTAHGPDWTRQRKAMTPAFLKARILALSPAMDRAGMDLTATFRQAAGPMDVTGPLNVATLSVIEAALFSEPAPGFDRAVVRAAIERVIASIGEVRFSDLVPLPEWVARPMGPKASAALRTLRAAVESQIAHRRETGLGEDMTSLLMASEDMSDRDVRDNLMSLVVAGHETTAITLSWALYLLSKDTATQGRVAEEARSALASDADPATGLAKLTFTRQVIEEALRLYPPAPMLSRRAMRASRIAERETTRGDLAITAFYAMHRHHRYWDNPDAFDPDRFAPDRRPTDPWVFRPFGGGPRACIGNAFAMNEAVLVLARVAAELEILDAGDVPEPVMTITLRPKTGLRLGFKPRD
ncbi:MAG: cytochrome P450 [Maricaulis sp.]|nr:cytochrome P450 [Maricaulis sp.]